jgi:hypothetical protein
MTRRTRFLIITLLLISGLAAAAYISGDHGHGFVRGADRTLAQPDIGEIPDLLARAAQKEPFVIIRGDPPMSEGGDWPSYDNFTDIDTHPEILQYLYPEGPVIGFGHDSDGYVDVTLWNGPPPPATTMTPDDLYATLDAWGEEAGIENVPVRFTVLISPPVLILHRR